MLKNKLALRTVTGVVFVLVLVLGIVWHPLSFAVLFAVITALTTREFCILLNKHMDAQVNTLISTVASTYFFLAVFCFNVNLCGSEVFIPYIITIMYVLISELYFDRPNSVQNWAYTMLSQFYIALPFALLSTLSFEVIPSMSAPSLVYYPVYTLGVFCFLWASDSGAYCFGSMFGRHRLFPRVSPKKSWEGLIGGGVTALIASQVLASFFYIAAGDGTDSGTAMADGGFGLANRLVWAGFALVVVAFGTWGDLVESLLKRKMGVKDSGNILPGHGGMLDRFDSALMAIPASVVYIYTFNSSAFGRMGQTISSLFSF